MYEWAKQQIVKAVEETELTLLPKNCHIDIHTEVGQPFTSEQGNACALSAYVIYKGLIKNNIWEDTHMIAAEALEVPCSWIIAVIREFDHPTPKSLWNNYSKEEQDGYEFGRLLRELFYEGAEITV